MDIKNTNQLWKAVTAFVRHRERLMLHYGALRTTHRMKTVGELFRLLDHFKNASDQAKVRVISNHLHLLHTIAAGRKSKYRNSDLAKIEAITVYCKQQSTAHKREVVC